MRLLAAVIAVVCTATGAAADEDGARAAFEPCRACHGLEVDAGLMPGPSLSGLIGRVVGGDPSFGYSPVLRAAKISGLVWTPGRLEAFLADPEGMFPGMWMSSPGIRDAVERAALARFIAAEGGD